MIKPPFTILILKNEQRPVTVRITTLSLLLYVTVVPLIFGVAGYSAGFFFRQARSPESPNQISGTIPGVSHKQPAMRASARADSLQAGMGGFFSSRTPGGGMEISFTPTNIPEGENCHIWVILNPEGDPGEQIIHPRSPVFRGMPVDYRNGVPFLSAREKNCTIVMDSIPDDFSITGIRILMYSSTGRVLADAVFAVGQQARM